MTKISGNFSVIVCCSQFCSWKPLLSLGGRSLRSGSTEQDEDWRVEATEDDAVASALFVPSFPSALRTKLHNSENFEKRPLFHCLWSWATHQISLCISCSEIGLSDGLKHIAFDNRSFSDLILSWLAQHQMVEIKIHERSSVYLLDILSLRRPNPALFYPSEHWNRKVGKKWR